MPKRRIPLVTGSYRDSNRHWSRQECIGWLPVRAEQPGTLTEWQLRQLPGCKPFVHVGTSVAGESGPEFTPAGVNRGLRNVEGKLFVVSGNQLYQISNAGVAIPRGTIPGVGRVSMAHNANGLGNELLVVNGFAGYVWNTQTQAFGKVTDTGYPGAFIADFVDQYLAQVEPGGRYWFHSDLADAHSYNTLDQYVAEGDPDRIVSLIVSHREVLVLGKKTIEPYVNTGGATGTFERASNTVIEVGCSARYSVKRMDGSPFWLDDQRLIRRLDGYTPVILSTDPVAQAFAECTEAEIAQAYAFTWEPAGHKVYYITVPGRFTFGYDAKTGQWHRRKTYGLNHWAVVDVVSWNGKWIAADSRSSKLYELDDKYPLDECEPLERELTAPTVWADQNPLTLDSVELMLDAAGQSVECVEFPEQPVGPTISGDAPGTGIGQTYPAFQYTITPGDSPVIGVRRMSGSLPPGLSLSEGGEITGEPTQLGDYTFVVRVTDANGLWDELTDTISVANAVMMLGRDLEGPGPMTSLTWDNGETWSIPEPSVADSQYLVGGRDRWALIADGALHTTEDWGATWDEKVAPVSFSRGTAVRGDVWLAPELTGGDIAVSTNNTTTFGIETSGYGAYAAKLSVGDAMCIRLDGGPIRKADPDGTNWTDAASLSNNFTQESVAVIVNDGTTFVIGAEHNAVYVHPRTPGFWVTDDALAVDQIDPPYESTTFITAMAYGEVAGSKFWVAGTDNGETYWSHDPRSEWFLAPGTKDAGRVNDIAFTGTGFLIFRYGATSNDIAIHYTTDFQNFVARTPPLRRIIGDRFSAAGLQS